MTELFIFNQNDELLTIITEETGLVSAPVRIEINSVPDTPFSFTVEAEAEYQQVYDDESNLTQVAGSFIGTMGKPTGEKVNVSPAQFVKEENKVVYRDHEGDLRLVVIKEIEDVDGENGPETTAICEPEFMELSEHIVVDRRFVDKEAQEALDAALEGTRYVGEVEVDLGIATTNFYYINSLEAIWEILEVWGGEFKDVVEFDEQNNIVSRKIKIIQRLGADTGQRFEIDHNITEIGRTVLSYPLTAMYGRGASLETEGGGNTRYIDFADVEWKISDGDPVDKPLGQRWVGDPEALQRYGRWHKGELLHREGIFSNQDYEDKEELLWATWDNLQENKHPEVNYRLSVDLFDDKVSLGDTSIAIDRLFARPIEIQARIVAMEYDLMDIENTMVVEMGQLLDLDDDRVSHLQEEVEKLASRPQTINEDSFPDVKPPRPTNVRAEGGFQVIQLYWDYANTLSVKHYEVYGSQVKDFVPDSQQLLWRGDVSAFAHEVDTDETWYYYVRAVNHHGTPSDLSEQVSASTVRVISDDILFGEGVAQELRDLNRISDIVGEGNISLENLHSEIPDYMKQEAAEYTDAEVEETRNELLGEIADKAGIEYVDDRLLLKADSETVTALNNTVSDLQGTAADLLQSVSDNEDALATQGGKITTIETNIDTERGRIDAVINDLSDIDGVITQQRTDINANAEAISLKASQDELDTVSGNVSSLSGSLEVLAGEVSLKASQETVEGLRSDFDNLEIGGRNLFKKSSTFSKLVGNANPSHNELNGITVKPTQEGRNTFRVNRVIPENGTYTVSFDVRANTEGSTMGTDLTDVGGNVGDEITITTEWKRYTKTTTTTRYTDSTFHFVDFNFEIVGSPTIEIRNLKLERGNKATDWTPAPEDTEAEFSSVNKKVSDLSITVDGIETDVSEISKEVTDQGTWISDANTTLTQLPDLLAAKVSVDQYTTDQNGVVERFKSNESSIRANEEAINAKVSETDFDTFSGNVSQRMAEYEQDLDGIETTVSSIRIGGRNLIPDSRGDSLTGWRGFNSSLSIIEYDGDDWIRSVADSTTVGIHTPMFNLKANTDYTISFDFKSHYNSGNYLNYIYLRRGEPAGSVKKLDTIDIRDFGADVYGKVGRIYFTFSYTEDIEDARILIGADSFADGAGIAIKEIQIEEGNMPTDWGLSPYETDQRMSISESSIEQLSDKMTFKVDKDNVVSQININPEGIRLDGDLIHLDGTSLIDRGVIQSAHIANAAIEKSHLGTAIIDDAHIDELTGNVFVAHSIVADKLSVAELSSISHNVGTLSAGVIRSDNYTTHWNLNTGVMTINTDVAGKYIQLDGNGLYARRGAITIERPDGAQFIQDGIPKYEFTVSPTEPPYRNIVQPFGTGWLETWETTNQSINYYSFKHEGRYLKVYVLAGLSQAGNGSGAVALRFSDRSDLNAEIFAVNSYNNYGENGHTITVDLGTPTYINMAFYLMIRTGRGDNPMRIRKMRIWQEG